MFDLRHELWDTEEEEEEEEGSSSAEPEESSSKECQEGATGGWQDPAIHRPSQWRPREQRHCCRRLFAPSDWQDKGHSQGCTGHRRDSGAEIKPWGGRSLPLDPPLRSWTHDPQPICTPRDGCLAQAPAVSSRTVSHPSFQTFFTAVSACCLPCPPSPRGQGSLPPRGGPLPLVDHSAFFYTDPMMPPGCRIYNRLSASSREVLQSLPLNTPAPIMCTGVAPPGRRWLSEPECRALSGLPALPAGARGDASPCPGTGAAECEASGAPAPCPEAPLATGAA